MHENSCEDATVKSVQKVVNWEARSSPSSLPHPGPHRVEPHGEDHHAGTAPLHKNSRVHFEIPLTVSTSCPFITPLFGGLRSWLHPRRIQFKRHHHLPASPGSGRRLPPQETMSLSCPSFESLSSTPSSFSVASMPTSGLLCTASTTSRCPCVFQCLYFSKFRLPLSSFGLP